LDAIERALTIAQESGTLCILNPAPARELPTDILKQVHILTPNQSEAKALSGIDTETLEGAAEAGRVILGMGVQTVVITMGADGALVVKPDAITHVRGYVIDAIDTSGAGDAFMAGFGVALGESQPLIRAVCLANKVGALSTTKQGATPSMPTRADVETFAQQVDY